MIIFAFVSFQNIPLLSRICKESDEEVIDELNSSDELPFQEKSHFKKFEIRYRNTVSMEDVKQFLPVFKKMHYC